MGIFDMTKVQDDARANKAARAAGGKPTRGGGTEDAQRPKAQVYANIGITLPGAGEDGADLFVSLPYGLPLDTMNKLELRGKNVEWNHLVQAKNKLLEDVLEGAQELDAGEGKIAARFEVQIYRASDADAATDPKDNPLLALPSASRTGTEG